MQNFIQSGKVLSLVAPAGGVLSGEFVVVGGLHGFAITDAAEGAIVSVSREGVFSAPKAGVELHQGDPLFWDAGNKVFTTVAQDDPIRAIAAEDAASGAATVPVVLVTPIEEGGGEGYDPDGTTIDLVADQLHVKTGGHTHSGGEVTTAVAEATHAASADTATSATSAGDADTLDGQHASEFAAAGHTHDDLPSADEKDALAGTNGTPSSTNKYVTDSDPRLGGGGGPGLLAVFTGSNGAGPCSVPGATVGMHVEFVLNMTDESADGSKFEGTITVDDQIQQTDVGDLSTKHFFLIGG